MMEVMISPAQVYYSVNSQGGKALSKGEVAAALGRLN